MTEALSRPNLLSLDHYARVMGIDPLHFQGGFSTVRPEPGCSDVWYQHDWQDPKKVSRDQVARLIAEAEFDLANEIGYWPAPTYIEEEFVQYPHPQRKDMTGFGWNVSVRPKTIKPKWGYVIEGGQRADELLGTEGYLRFDADGDGFAELAQFVLTVPATFNTTQIRAYYKVWDAPDAENCRTDPSSTGPDPAWEIRPLRSQLVGTTLTIWIKAWQLFRPQLHEALNASPIDADDADVYVDEIIFYREYTDPETQVQFLWGADIANCDAACARSTQAGCFSVTDQRSSFLAPRPATFADGVFTGANWAETVEPDAVRLWYRAGFLPNRYRSSMDEPLSQYWAKLIAMLATARLEWPLCSCTNVQLLADKWREDLARINVQRSFSVTPDDLQNPFGTRAGEALAWKRITKSRGRKIGQAVLT